MRTQNHTSITDRLIKTINGSVSFHDENRIVGGFGSFLMIVGALSSFLSLRFLLFEAIRNIWVNSLSMFVAGLAILAVSRLVKNERIKKYIFSALFSVYLLFVVVQYYTYIGPAVWTIAVILALISILYQDRFMLIVITITIAIVLLYFIFTINDFYRWDIFYLAQVVTMGILLMVILVVHKIISIRSLQIHDQNILVQISEKKLQITLKSIGDGVIAVDETGIIEFINPVAHKLTGWHPEEAIGKPFDSVFHIINEYTREPVESPIKQVFESKQIVEMANHTLLVAKDGMERPIEDTAAPIIYESEAVNGVILVFRDFSEKKQKQMQIEYLSYHDQLTGLYNRRFFEDEIKRLDTQSNLPLSLIYADINGLKIINDAFGHENGDQIIQWVAEILKNECCTNEIIARVGGDEFIILLPKTDESSVGKIVARIGGKIGHRTMMDIHLSVSFGWSIKNTVDQSVSDVLRKAEDFMYKRKIFNSSSMRNGMVKSIINNLFIKCPREKSHSLQVGRLCESMGHAYQLSVDEIEELRIAGELHDIGKIAIDETILNKPDQITEAEWDQIRKHPETGYRLLGATSEFNAIAETIFAHHERWDGTGYPRGLKHTAIIWKARVVAVADAYDAMTSEQPYRKALSRVTAVAEIKTCAGTQFDPDIAAIFLEKVLCDEV